MAAPKVTAAHRWLLPSGQESFLFSVIQIRTRKIVGLRRLVAYLRPEQARIRDKILAFYHLARGNHIEALEVFESAIVESARTPDRCAPLYICAAASAHELGLFKEARRHYENAELTLAFHDDRFVFAICITWLLALSRHWGWDGEATRWTETIQALDCPSNTRDCLFERSRALQETTGAGRAIAFA